jgi:hypothetical protein
MLIGLYVADAIIIALVIYGCCSASKVQKLRKSEEDDWDEENPNYLSFEE